MNLKNAVWEIQELQEIVINTNCKKKFPCTHVNLQQVLNALKITT